MDETPQGKVEIDQSRQEAPAAGMPRTEELASGRRPTDRAPPRVDGFEVLELLGEGSFGWVWKARDLSNGKTVAIKFFHHGATDRWQALLEEVQQHAHLDGVRGIVDLKKVLARNNPPCYVMAFADRGSLAGRLEHGPLPPAEAIELFHQAAHALAYVHAKGVCHCDLKPGNILLDARGRALLADFGQATLCSADSPALGTFFYMAPEQASLAEVLPDPRWDVYGLGAVLYASLTGLPPRFDEKVNEELAGIHDLASRLLRYRQWIGKAPAPAAHRRVAGMDAELARLIDRCLDPDPERRPRDAGVLLALLERWARRKRQRPILWVGLAASILALCVTALIGIRGKNAAVDVHQRELLSQQLDSDLTSASLVAEAVQEQLLSRLRRVEATATREMAVCLKRRDRDSLERMLLAMMSSDGSPSGRFAEATVSNANGELKAMARLQGGRLRAMDPRTLRTRYPHFSWRDWYSGRGDRYEEAHRFHRAVAAPHISDPYVSSMDPADLFISISVPIRDPAHPKREPLGVLEAAVRLQELSRWLRQSRIGRHGFVVLLDRRGYCVLHADPSFRPKFGTRPERFLPVGWEQELFPDKLGTIESYRDPVLGRDFMAGYARMTDPRIGWVALVQHDRKEMLAPTAALRQRLDWIGIQSFALVAAVTGGLWGCLFWMLKRSRPGEG
jgi:serine/threonine protein kinase